LCTFSGTQNDREEDKGNGKSNKIVSGPKQVPFLQQVPSLEAAKFGQISKVAVIAFIKT